MALLVLIASLTACDNSAANALRTCEGGNTEACYNDGLAAVTAAQPQYGDARKAFSAACRPSIGAAPSSVSKHLPKACNELAVLVRDAKGGPKDVPRATELFEIACKNGIPRACVDLGALLWTDDPAGKSDADRAVVLFEGACADAQVVDPTPAPVTAPVEPKARPAEAPPADPAAPPAVPETRELEGVLEAHPLAEACDRLGTAWKVGIGVEPPVKDQAKASEYFDRGCRGRYAPACVSAGATAASGRRKDDIAAAAGFYERACRLDPRQGCFELAELHDHKAWPAATDALAVKYYKEACAIDAMRGCFEAAAMMEEGRIKAGDGEIASLYNQACEHGHTEACARRAIKR
ncbi:MAG: hypothetical protein ABMA64_26985 [Myxococcota bacterium]